MKAVTKEERRVAYPLVLSFAILALGLVVGGTFYYQHYKRQFRAGIEQQLSTIADLKVDELVQYRKERLEDGAVFFNNTAFSGLVRRFFEHPEDAEAQQQIQEWIVKCTATDQYDLGCLFDAQGVARLSVPAGRPPISALNSRRVPEVLRSGRVAFQDLNRNEHDQRIYLTLQVPIFDKSDHSQALGVLALRINPEAYLYPFLSRWPTLSRTAETLLVRRDGNDVLFLNELKFQTNAALNLRISIENTNLAAVKAILGEKGIVEGMDYRGAPVLAALHAIPDSPWFMVARMDIAEVYAPLRERLWMTILLASFLLISVGLGIGAIWRHQRVQFYKERYQMAEALRESEERFGRVFVEGPIGMAMLDEKFRFIQVNPAFASMLGYSEEELQKMAFTDITHPDHVQGDVEQVRRLLRGELSVYQTEKRYIARSGKELWGQVQVAVVRNAAGAFRYFLAIIGDITARKRAEEVLANERALLRTLVDHLPLAVYLKDLAGRKTLVNQLEIEYLGATSEAEVLGKTDFDFYPREQAAIYQAFDQEIIRTGQPLITHEASFTKPDGSVIYLLASVVPLRDAAGRVTGLVGMNLDITERKRAEEALANERALLRTLVDNLPAAIYLKDLAGRKTLANRMELGYMGVASEAEVLGKTDFDFFPKEQAERYRSYDQEVIRSGQSRINNESSFTKPDGSVIYLSGSTVPLRDANGRVIGLAGINYDITDRKRIEERLLKVITQTRCILYSGHVTGPEGWRKRALERVSPFHWDTPVLNEQTAQKIVPLELVAGEPYMQAWERSWNRADAAQMNWNSGNAFLNDLPFYRNEYRCTDKHGVGHWMQEMVTVQKLAENHWQIFSIALDISDLKRIETELRESQALYHSLVDQMPAGVFRKDAKGRYVFVNSTFCRLKEMSPDQFLGKTVLEVESKDVALATKDASHHATIVQSGNSIEDDEVHSTADGETRYYHAVKSPVFDSAGKIAGTQGVLFDITELKQATLRIADALNFNQTVLRASPVGIVAFKASGSCVSANETIGQIIGGTREEVLKQNFRQFESWKHSGMLAAAEAALAAQTERNLETQLVTTFGRKAWFSCRFAPFHYEGEPHLLIVINDITERKRAAEALKESEARYQRITEAITDYIFTVRVADGRAVETTHGPGCFAVTGYQVKEFTNDPFLWFRMVAAEDRSSVEEQSRRILAGEDPPPIEHRIVRKNGTVRWVRNTFAPHRDERGTLVSYDGLLQDITERKRAEEALHWSETQLQVILESTADGILAVDNKGKMIKTNRRFAELWRIPQSLMDTRDDRALLDFVLAQLSEPDMFLKKEQSLYNTDAVDMDTLTFKDGRIFERYYFPMMMDGAVIGRVWSFRDITERKRQEKELIEKSSELERFTYTVSHDLKSPLVTLKTFLGYLEQDMAGPDKERVKQDVAYMHTAADKMGQLLDELLNLACVGRKMNPAERVTFKELAQEAVRLVAGRISTGGAEVQVADATVVLEGDRPRLMEIWQNLVENACKFMGNQPKPRVEIGVEQRGLETVFFVRDNGAGIDPRYQAKVFGLFEKLDPRGEGTGMGLALVRRIVEIYKGRIWVESPGLGQGATFLFTLPGAVIINPEQSS